MTNALIIGGGIAGPITAIALQRAGIEATVYEAYERSAGLEIGAYLTIAVNGLDALHTLGLRDRVTGAGFPTSEIEFFNARGRSLGRVPIGATLADGTVTHSIRRSDLYRILGEAATERGIPVHHGKRLVQAEVQPDGRVLARFSDGTTAAADLLIGADGIHSTVRRIIDPAAPAPRYTGVGNIGGFAPPGTVAADPGTYRMVFGRRCFFGFTVSPSGEVWWFGNPPRREPLTTAELRSTTSELWKRRLIDLYAGDAGHASEIVRATSHDVVGANQYEMPAVPNWARENIIVIGDAAHAASPTSGQGASMAIEDGVALATSLRDHPDPPAAYRAFEGRRRERVERVVAFGAERNAGKMPGPVGRTVQSLLLPHIFRRHSSPKAMRELDWLFGHHIEWGRAPDSESVHR